MLRTPRAFAYGRVYVFGKYFTRWRDFFSTRGLGGGIASRSPALVCAVAVVAVTSTSISATKTGRVLSRIVTVFRCYCCTASYYLESTAPSLAPPPPYLYEGCLPLFTTISVSCMETISDSCMETGPDCHAGKFLDFFFNVDFVLSSHILARKSLPLPLTPPPTAAVERQDGTVMLDNFEFSWIYFYYDCRVCIVSQLLSRKLFNKHCRCPPLPLYRRRANEQIYGSEKYPQGFCLDIAAGETVALVGPSGGGKSTCMGLLLRFYEPSKGSIAIDDRDIREVNVKWLRSQVCVL